MVRTFTKDDYPEILYWHSKQGTNPVPLEDLPSFGLIEPGVAAGFVVLTDARYGILEFYISNPDSRSVDRDKALDAITVGLIDYGKKFGIKYFKCDTNIQSVGLRAIKHGFAFMGKQAFYFMKG